jgi:thioredoxin-like negative regulator of GroEL
MKQYLVLFGLLFGLGNSRAEGIEFFHGTWAEAIAKSKETGKLIFMDAFTTWCGPCKKMSANTFPLKDVGEFYNAHFINLKVDMENGEGPRLAGTYSVDSYPTLLYIDGDGKLVSKAIGYMDGAKFISAGKAALKKNDKSDLYAKEYAAGKRDFTTVLNYVRALHQAGKSSTKIANEYLNTQKDLSTPENLSFLMEAMAESDSRIFDLFNKQQTKLIDRFGKEAVEQKILAAGKKTVQKAVEFNSYELCQEAIEKIKTHLPASADLFTFRSHLQYFSAVKDNEGLYNALKKMPKAVEKKSNILQELAAAIEADFPTDTKLLALTENLLEQNKSDDPSLAFSLSKIYVLNHKQDKAVKLLQQTIEQSKKRNQDTMIMEQYLLQIQKS